MFQKMILAGRLGADPEMRYTPKGSPVTNFSVAVQEGKEPAWFQVVAWGKLAETCNTYLAKGRTVLVEGKLHRSEWKDKEGQTRERWQLRADRVIFLPREGAKQPIEEEEIPF